MASPSRHSVAESADRYCCRTATETTRGGRRAKGDWRRISASSCRRTPVSVYRAILTSGHTAKYTRLDGLICFSNRFLKSQGPALLPVIGISMGAWLAKETAIRCPASCSLMVLAGRDCAIPPDPDAFGITAEEAKARLFFRPIQVPEDYAQRTQQGYRSIARHPGLENVRTKHGARPVQP